MLGYCFIFTLSYGIIESVYRKLTSGEITTIGQSVITFLWTPVIVSYFDTIDNQYLSIGLFPLNIWSCELITGGLSLYIFNTRYWYYDDNLSCCKGLISFSFIPHWVLLGYTIRSFLIMFPDL